MPYKISELIKAIDGKDRFADDPLQIIPLFADRRDLAKSGAASIDLRLGRWFLSLQHAKFPLLDISDKDSLTDAHLCKSHFVRFGDTFILHPRSFVLGSTLEWIKMPSICVGSIVGKSSLGRRGLIIETAPVVHPGFSGTLTLELANVGEVPIALRPGMQIAQLVIDAAEGAGTASGSFKGYRKPTLGNLSLDTVAKSLRKAR